VPLISEIEYEAVKLMEKYGVLVVEYEDSRYLFTGQTVK
jgi:hypothetical protein